MRAIKISTFVALMFASVAVNSAAFAAIVCPVLSCLRRESAPEPGRSVENALTGG
jgi:hypothetical protein